jgi:membrane associated rhomboid family serine protease
MNILLSVLYIIGLYGAYAAGSLLLRNQASLPSARPETFQFPQTTALLLLAIAIPSVLQFFVPGVLSLFERNYSLFISGDWWRLITPLSVQEGGISGTIFNLASLLLLGSVAERFWGGRRMLLIFFIGGIAAELVAFAWQPIGAGNSIGNFSLAAAIAVACLVRHPPRPIQIMALLALGADGVLLGLQNIHGAAAMVGAIQSLFLSRVERERVDR